MKRFVILALLTLSLYFAGASQQIVNYAMVGNNSITKKAKEAKFLIIVRKYSDTCFEREEYNFTGPLMDQHLQRPGYDPKKHGRYLEYSSEGAERLQGAYSNNQKDGYWHVYDDTMHANHENLYELGQAIHDWGEDSLQWHNEQIKKSNEYSTSFRTVEKEATYPDGGEAGYTKYVTQHLKYPDRATELGAHGTVTIQFVVDTTGKLREFQLIRSVEFSLDNAVLDAISNSPPWTPAYQNG